MQFALLQKDLTPPALDALKRAFRAVKFLTETDALILGRDAFGILVKNLTAENASALQGALRAEGVETEIADQRALPELPPTKFLPRLDCLPDGLWLYDPLGRRFKLEWGHVWLIAAGNVRLSDFKRVEQVCHETRYGADGWPHLETTSEVSTREELNGHLLLELVLTRAVARYSVRADTFNFIGLGDRRTRSLPENFALLVRDLIQFAPHASLNLGASGLRQEEAVLFTYPSKSAFFEEITWLLWQMRQPVP